MLLDIIMLIIIIIVIMHTLCFICSVTSSMAVLALSGCNFTTSCQRGSVANLIECDFGCATPQITVDYEIPMWSGGALST